LFFHDVLLGNKEKKKRKKMKKMNERKKNIKRNNLKVE